MLAKAKQGDPSVDYAKLRELFFDSTYFDTKDEQPMFAALNKKDYKTALASAEQVISQAFVNMDAHLVAMISNKELGNAEQANVHRQILHKLLDSITGGKDGRSEENAWVVMEVHEEYEVLRLLGLQPQMQADRHNNGHHYDVMTALDPQSGRKVQILFNMDHHWKELEKALGGDTKK